MSLNKGTAAMLVSLTNPPGIELYYRKRFLLFWWKTKVTDHVSENTLQVFLLVPRAAILAGQEGRSSGYENDKCFAANKILFMRN